MGKFLKFLGGVFLVLLVIGFFATPKDNNISVSGLDQPKQSDSPNYIVKNPHVETNEFGGKVITGILKNNSSRDVGYVQISISLYDKKGVQVGSTFANTNNLDKNERWRFEAGTTKKFTRFEIEDVSGF